MPQDPTVQSAQGEPTKKPDTSSAGGIDLGKILLPKKDNAPSKDSAQRVNAGALLQQETAATLPKTPPPPPPAPAPKPQSDVRPIETYQGDIENLVQSKNVSVVNIAAAEAARRGQPGTIAAAEAAKEPIDIAALLRRGGIIVAGVVLVLAAGGALWWVLAPAPSVDVQVVESAPFIKVDTAEVLTVPTGNFSHANFIHALAVQRDAVSLSLGLIERLQLAVASSTPQGQILIPFTTKDFLTRLSPGIPDELLRALSPTMYLLAVHSFSDNQPLLMLEADSYEAAYAGMLKWEQNMRTDLLPLFVRTPSPTLDEPTPAPLATSTATSTSAATSTASTTPPAPVQPATPVIGGFVDRIVENHDARVVEDQNNSILLLWTFIDRKVIIITTNEATLREAISRLNTPAVVPTP